MLHGLREQGILFLSNENNIISADETMESAEGETTLMMRAKLVGEGTTQQQPGAPPQVTLLCEPYKGEPSSHFSSRIVNYVWRTKTHLLVTDALHNNEQFAGDPYLKNIGRSGPVSILCAAVTYKKQHCGVIFLENTVNFGAFNDERLKLVQILIAQFMISYENAQLVATLKQRNDELKKKNEELKELDKMKDSFLAVSNHELRTPLTGIMGMTSLLEETALDEEQREYVKDIKSCSESLLKITNDMLYLCKLKAMKVTLERRIFCVSECLETCMKVVELGGGLQKGLAMNYVVEDGVPELVVGDYLRVRQVVLNLWTNAIKFTEQGEVVVSVSVWNGRKADEERAMKEAQEEEEEEDEEEDEDKPSTIFVQDNRGVLETSRWTERTTNGKRDEDADADADEERATKEAIVEVKEYAQSAINNKSNAKMTFGSPAEGREIIEEVMKGAEKVELHFQVKDTGESLLFSLLHFTTKTLFSFYALLLTHMNRNRNR